MSQYTDGNHVESLTFTENYSLERIIKSRDQEIELLKRKMELLQKSFDSFTEEKKQLEEKSKTNEINIRIIFSSIDWIKNQIRLIWMDGHE